MRIRSRFVLPFLATLALGLGACSGDEPKPDPDPEPPPQSLHQVPGAPTGVSATTGQIGELVVTWTAPADDGGAPILRYTVTATPGGASQEVTAPTTRATFTGLTGGTAYQFVVVATNEEGDGPASEPSAAVAPLGPPSALTSTLTVSPSSVPADGSTALGITVVVRDAAGQPLSGLEVHLSSSPAFDDALSLASGTTDAEGAVTSGLTSGRGGARLIQAEVDGVTLRASGSFQVAACEGTLVFGNPPEWVSKISSLYGVTPADLNEDGIDDLAVSGYAEVSIFLGNTGGAFVPQAAVTTGYFTTSSPLAADLNGDGHADLAVLETSPTPGLHVYLGVGDGTFGDSIGTALPSRPAALTAGDFNEDGLLDLATSQATTDTLELLLGNGDGTFTDSGAVAAGDAPIDLRSADVNGDDHLDLVVVEYEAGTVTSLLGDGTGAFPDSVSSRVSTQRNADRLALGDFNQDGQLDVAVTSESTEEVAVALGVGDGSFGEPATFAADTRPMGIVAADFDGDGQLDLAASNAEAADVSVLRGRGDGTFDAALTYPAPLDSWALAAADYNGDGALDLVTAAMDAHAAGLLLGNGDGTFRGARRPDTGNAPSASASGDFNLDGWPDLAVSDLADGSLRVLLGAGEGALNPAEVYPVGTSLTDVVAADLDQDGLLDLVATDSAEASVKVLRGRGDGTFEAQPELAVGNGPSAVLAADLDQDGAVDLAVTNADDDTVSLMLGTGGGAFAPAATLAVGTTPVGLVACHYDEDPTLDLAVVHSGMRDVYVLNGDGSGGFTLFAAPTGPGKGTGIASGDFNGDALCDLALSDWAFGTFDIITPTSGGSLSRSVGTLEKPADVAVADLDLDGKDDVLLVNEGDRSLALFAGKGDATFQDPVVYPELGTPTSLLATDLDLDGRPDLVVTSSAGVSVLRQSACLP